MGGGGVTIQYSFNTNGRNAPEKYPDIKKTIHDYHFCVVDEVYCYVFWLYRRRTPGKRKFQVGCDNQLLILLLVYIIILITGADCKLKEASNFSQIPNLLLKVK